MMSRLIVAAVLVFGGFAGFAGAYEVEHAERWVGCVSPGYETGKYVWLEPGQMLGIYLEGSGRSDLDLRLDAVSPSGAHRVTVKRAASLSCHEQIEIYNDTAFRGYFRIVVENDGPYTSSFQVTFGVVNP